jgi:hypothetical protein
VQGRATSGGAQRQGGGHVACCECFHLGHNRVVGGCKGEKWLRFESALLSIAHFL